MTGLKPCPFCGGEAYIFSYDKFTNHVKCKKCSVITDKAEDIDYIISTWNTRQPVNNWQPIEEFTADSIKDIEVNDWLFYSDTDTEGPKVYTIVIGMQNTYVNFQSFTYTVDGLCTLNHDELIVFIKDRNITYFAELTVPEVK